MPFAETNGMRLYYEVEGDGLPLLMIMGLSAQHQWWPRSLIDSLKAQGFQIIRFDNRDIGASTRLNGFGRPNIRQAVARALMGAKVDAPYRLDDLADDAVGLLDVLGIDRAHIIGGSMGGMVAQRVALNHAHRVASLGLLYTSSGSRLDGLPTRTATQMLMRPPPQGRDETIERFADVGRVLTGEHYPFNEPYWRDLGAACFDHNRGEPGTPRQLAAVLASGTTRHRLHEIKQPTLVIHGAADPLVRPRGGVRLARGIKGSRLLMFDGVGHHLPPQVHETVAANIRLNAARAA